MGAATSGLPATASGCIYANAIHMLVSLEGLQGFLSKDPASLGSIPVLRAPSLQFHCISSSEFSHSVAKFLSQYKIG